MKLSRRALDIVPSQIRRITDRARPTSLHLGLGQPDLPLHPEVSAALETYVGRARAPYTPNLGLSAAREAVAEHYGLEVGQTMLVAGVQEGLALVLLGLVEPGDEVLVPDPGFPAYANLVRVAGGTPVAYALDGERGWALDAQAVAEKMTARTRLILFNSPSNPTGALHGAAELSAVLDLCAQRGVMWVSDEIYEDFVYEGQHLSPAATHPELGVRVGGLSKSHAMMGWRLGWVTGPEAVVEGLKGLHQHLVTSANGAAQSALPAAMSVHRRHTQQMREVFLRRGQVLKMALDEAGLACPAPQGAFYHFVPCHEAARLAGGSVALAEKILEETDVVTIPGAGFGAGGEGFLRLAYTVDEPQLIEAGARIGAFVADVVARG